MARTSKGTVIVACAALLCVLLAHPASAQVSLTTPGTAYTQNFNTLGNNNGTSYTWTNNSTLTGWYATRSTYQASRGGSATGNLKSYGPDGNSDRALGSIATGGTGGTGTIRYGVRLANNTGGALSSFSIAFTGEQWRDANNNAQTLAFEYQVGATSLTSGSWTALTALNFVSPTHSNSGALDGNATANRQSLSATLTVTVAAGQEIWLRWTDVVDTGSNHGLAVDEFSVTPNAAATPPSVSSTTPTNSAVGVAVNADVTVNFDQQVNVAAGWYTITCGTSGSHTGTVTPSSGPASSYTIDPSSDFSNGETCTVTIVAADVANTGSVHMASDYVFSFSTIAAPPAVSGTAPSNGATGIGVDSDVSITFSKDVTVSAGWYTTSCATSGVHTAVESGGPLTFNLNPNADFVGSEVCTVTVVHTAVASQDVPPSGMASDYVFSFTVGPTVPPSGVGATAPAFIATGDTALFTMTVTLGSNPVSTGVAVTCDFSPIHGSSTQLLYDDASHGDQVADDDVFSFEGSAVDTPTVLTPGAFSLPCTITDDQAASVSSNIPLTLVYHVHTIQGSGNTSPLVNMDLTTRGIVTALLSDRFFIQEPEATYTTEASTSEGLQIGTTPTGLNVGDSVAVTGTVEELVTEASPLFPTTTELGNVTLVSVLSTGNTLPEPVGILATDTDPTGDFFQLEKYEGMRARSSTSFTVVAPTGGTMDPSSGTATNDGNFWATVTGVNRPFRETGIHVMDGVGPSDTPPGPCTSPCTPASVPRWDGNPELFGIASAVQDGASPYNAVAGEVDQITGVLAFSTSAGLRAWQIYADPNGVVQSAAGPALTAASAPAFDEFTVASFNLANLQASAMGWRGGKLVMAIRDFLNLPDIVAVEGVDNSTTLDTLATQINGASTASYAASGAVVTNVGFLLNGAIVTGTTPRVALTDLSSMGVSDTLTNPDSSTEPLYDHLPLRLKAIVNDANTASFPVTVFVVNQMGLDGVGDMTAPGPNGWATVGDRVRAKRAKQAESLATMINSEQGPPSTERIVVLGDFNAYELNDGYVDVMNTTTGALPTTPNTEVVLASAYQYATPPLARVPASAAAQEYVTTAAGSALNLEHILVNTELQGAAAIRLDHARINADYPVAAYNDTSSATRAADHDPLVAYFQVVAFDTANLSVSKTGPAMAQRNDVITYDITFSNAGPNAATNAKLVDTLSAGTTFFSMTAPGDWACTHPAVGSTGTITCTKASMDSMNNPAFSISVTVSSTAALGSTLTNTVVVSSDATDLDTSHNTATVSTTVVQKPAITSANHTSFSILTPGSFTFTATGSPTPDITLTGTLPAGLVFTPGKGSATLTGTPKAGSAGTYTLTVGAASTAGSASQTFTLAVLGATTTTTVVSYPNPSTGTAAVRFTGRVSFTAHGLTSPTGTIQFLINGSPLGTATMVGGAATITAPMPAVGTPTTYVIRALYSGDGNFAPSSGTLPGGQVVNP
jgi:uncharacterized repeat protein (TIGR01451 family)